MKEMGKKKIVLNVIYGFLLILGMISIFTQKPVFDLPSSIRILINVFLLVFGFFLLIRGSDIFIENAAKIAQKLGVSQHLIGLTLVAFATSIPELAVSGIASAQHEGGVALGNVIGSNIANICLVLGVSTVIMRLKVTKETFRDALFMLGVTYLLFAVLIIDQRLDWYDGLLFIVIYIMFLFYLYKTHKVQRAVEKYMEDVNLTYRFIMVIVGVAGVLVGAQLLVDSSVEIAESFGISSYIIGASIVAIGTSLPELASSVAAALKGKHGIAIGNVIGSNIINILLVLGIASSIFTIRISDIKDGSLILNLTLPLLIVISIIMTLFIKMKMKKWQGALLLALYVLFLVLLFL